MAKGSRRAPAEGPSAKAARLVGQSFPGSTQAMNQPALTPAVRQLKGDDQGAAETARIVDSIHGSAEKANPDGRPGNLDPSANIDQDTLIDVQGKGSGARRVAGSTDIGTGLGLRNT